MANTQKKKLKAPATVTVVFDETITEFEDVLAFTEDEDGGLLLERHNNTVKVRPVYRYYEINYEE